VKSLQLASKTRGFEIDEFVIVSVCQHVAHVVAGHSAPMSLHSYSQAAVLTGNYNMA